MHADWVSSPACISLILSFACDGSLSRRHLGLVESDQYLQVETYDAGTAKDYGCGVVTFDMAISRQSSSAALR